MGKPLKKHEVIYETLRFRIFSGELSPGDKLPNERMLAKQFGVAGMTLRQALDRLEDEGHLIRRPYHGTFVATAESVSPDKQKFRVGFVVSGISTIAHPVTSRLLNGIEGIASECGAAIVFVVSDPGQAASEELFLATIEDSSIDGWIIPARISDRIRAALERCPAPKILLHSPDEKMTGHFFGGDYNALGLQIGGHLKDGGYKNITILALRDICYLDERFGVALQAAMGSAQAKVKFHEMREVGAQAGAEACEKVLAEHRETDAFICEDDDIALGVMRVLKEKGLTPPRIGVIGAGDFPAGALVEPQLTTVFFPYYQVGREVARLLLDLLLKHPVEPAHRTFHAKLIVRESTRSFAVVEAVRVGMNFKPFSKIDDEATEDCRTR